MSRGRRGLRWLFGAVVVGLMASSIALAHIERPSYFPDPAPDTAVTPPTGGAVPKVRGLVGAA